MNGVNKIDYEAMHRAITEIEHTEKSLNNVNSTMLDHTNDLAKAYTGESGTRYHNLMESWNGKFNDIIRQLERIRVSLHDNLRANMKNEENNSPLINRIQTLLQS
jgi:WXG100 family type VII secretion target